MKSNSAVSSAARSRRRRLLAPSQKYEMYVAVLTGQSTQREAADKWKVDRSTVTVICRTAKQGALAALSARPGRPGKSPGQVEIEELRVADPDGHEVVLSDLHASHGPRGRASLRSRIRIT